MPYENKLIKRILRKKPLPNEAIIKQHEQDILEARLVYYPLKTIWEDMKEAGEISCSYDTFRRIINKWDKGGLTKQIDNSSVSGNLTKESPLKADSHDATFIDTSSPSKLTRPLISRDRPMSEKLFRSSEDDKPIFEWNPTNDEEELFGPSRKTT